MMRVLDGKTGSRRSLEVIVGAETKGCTTLGLRRMTASLVVALWPKRGKSNDRQDHRMFL